MDFKVLVNGKVVAETEDFPSALMIYAQSIQINLHSEIGKLEDPKLDIVEIQHVKEDWFMRMTREYGKINERFS